VDQGEQLASWSGRTRPVAKIDELVGGLLNPQPLGQGGGSSSPAEATARSSSNAISTSSNTTCEDRIEKVSSESGIVTAWQPSFSLVRGPFSYSRHYTAVPDRWIQAEMSRIRPDKDVPCANSTKAPWSPLACKGEHVMAVFVTSCNSAYVVQQRL
jgi:hypothetical protein